MFVRLKLSLRRKNEIENNKMLATNLPQKTPKTPILRKRTKKIINEAFKITFKTERDENRFDSKRYLNKILV